MITEALCNMLFNFLFGWLDAIPIPNLKLYIRDEFDAIGVLAQQLATIGYFIPVSTIVQIFLMSFSLDLINLLWKIGLRVKSFIPTMGD